MSVAAHRFSNELRYRSSTHPDQTQFTPPYVLTLVRQDLGGRIELDPCTTADNPTRAVLYYTVEDDGLARPWHDWQWGPSIFVNPPYGKAREPWVDRCIDAANAGAPIVLLIPAATDTRTFQKAAGSAAAIVFIRGRLKFGVLRPNRRQVASSHPSALIGWNTDLAACGTLGVRFLGAA